jgi:hypothetical protein
MNTTSPHASHASPASGEAQPLRNAAARYRISVVEDAVIVERGERRRKWFVRDGDEWLRVSDFPGAVLETGDDDSDRCPRGVVWQRCYELSLARGTLLMTVSSFPRAGARSTFWYLNHGVGQAELVYQQRQYVVAGNYRLVERGQMQQRIGSRANGQHEPDR